MSTCSACGAQFGCAMADGGAEPCWCTALPPVVALPGAGASCWCPACLKQHIEAQQIEAGRHRDAAPGTDLA
ncbi:MAG: cysteine-rich CWC family protein [Pseudomonadota bacterium]